MKKILLLLFITLLTLNAGYSASTTPLSPNKCISEKTKELTDSITTLHLSVCLREDVRRTGIYGVICIKQTFKGISILAYFDCSLGVVPKCKTGKLPSNYKPNTIQINGNEFFVNSLDKTDIELFMPTELIHLKTSDENQFLLLETYNVSHTTVGGGYAYIVMQLDANGELLEHYTTPLRKTTLSRQGIIQMIDKHKRTIK